MIIVDTALQKRADAGKPIRVGVIGAGYMGRGMIMQIITAFKGMEVSAVYNRTIVLTSAGLFGGSMISGSGSSISSNT
ncbi:MAG: hypothetical protein ACPGSC_08590, partial [Granulosicoccaceae bacterium]